MLIGAVVGLHTYNRIVYTRNSIPEAPPFVQFELNRHTNIVSLLFEVYVIRLEIIHSTVAVYNIFVFSKLLLLGHTGNCYTGCGRFLNL